MPWISPLRLKLVPSKDSLSFTTLKNGETALPLAPHPGAFGVQRKHHFHEGVDLYCPEGTPVHAVEDGQVVAVLPFTGAKAGMDWWEDTDAVLVEGATGVVVYGEISPAVQSGAHVKAGEILGHVKRVLKVDKGRPMSMLHLELHAHGARVAPEWPVNGEKPGTLLDPTLYLSNAVTLANAATLAHASAREDNGEE
jgi:murein DD-endopeptidase MepM/ murein hydrolase activator NlpD